ncbi:MAG TPA: TetR/AcrR family transcriptional regulator, partial [Spirochaetes bacterium]|nr:TetR/AcrR family transcriptional regulator [Spirochaetota bacterium]
MSEDKENIRQKILEVAEKRIDHYGFNKTTVEEIAEDANIGKGSIYSHFKSKKEILIALIVAYNQCILKDIEEVFTSPLPVYERFLNLIITRFVS